jgi:ribonucleoside-diphosphate reductase alpha chain
LEDIANAYKDSWSLMLKATALYRDGSKLSQPLSSQSNDNLFAELFRLDEVDVADETVSLETMHAISQLQPQRLLRRRLPDERHSITHKFEISGLKGYITVGLYEDGQPGEIFISMQKIGSTMRGILDALAVSLSWNLQYGVPLEELVRKFTHVRFEPSGMTSNREIPIAKSIIDYIASGLQ